MVWRLWCEGWCSHRGFNFVEVTRSEGREEGINSNCTNAMFFTTWWLVLTALPVDVTELIVCTGKSILIANDSDMNRWTCTPLP